MLPRIRISRLVIADMSVLFSVILVVACDKAAARRALSTAVTAPSCGEILATWKSSEIESIIVAAIDSNFGSDGALLLKSMAIPFVQYGVQVRKICAACTETTMDDCADRYGSNVANSGLLMIPLEDDGSDTIAKGNHKAILYNHGTTAVTQPSSDWAGEDSGFEIVLNLIFAATSRSVVIMADYMGQGESFGKVHRGYLVRESYVTSIVPLLWKAGQILDEETACLSRLSGSIFLMGYSEGGYASIAVADKLHSMGMDIIQVHPGGAPYMPSSANLVEVVESIREGIFPDAARFLLVFAGFSLSSTRDDIVNFEQGQDILTNTARQNMLDFIASPDFPTDEWAGVSAINDLVPSDDMLSVYDPGFMEFLETALAVNDTDPCANLPSNYDLLCQALKAQDIDTVLLDATYPVSICHSQDDEIVSFLNVPDISENPYLSLLSIAGGHTSAGYTCGFVSIQYILSEEFRNYKVQNKTDESCNAFAGYSTTVDSDSTDATFSMHIIAYVYKWIYLCASVVVFGFLV